MCGTQSVLLARRNVQKTLIGKYYQNRPVSDASLDVKVVVTGTLWEGGRPCYILAQNVIG
jgi:hypothetical protein